MIDTKKCKGCKYYHHFSCRLFADANVYELDKCALSCSFINSIKDGSFESYIVYETSDVVPYLKWLSYQRKDIFPKVGDKVLTLTAGFNSSEPGKILTVTSYPNEYDMYLKDKDGNEFVVQPDLWYIKLFVLEE